MKSKKLGNFGIKPKKLGHFNIKSKNKVLLVLNNKKK